MFDALKDMKENDRVGDFLFPSLPSMIKGKISFLLEKLAVVDSEVDGEVYQYITHPNNVCIVQIKV